MPDAYKLGRSSRLIHSLLVHVHIHVCICHIAHHCSTKETQHSPSHYVTLRCTPRERLVQYY